MHNILAVRILCMFKMKINILNKYKHLYLIRLMLIYTSLIFIILEGMLRMLPKLDAYAYDANKFYVDVLSQIKFFLEYKYYVEKLH